MPQLILRPEDTPKGQAVVEGPLSERERSLGKVIDQSLLLPGDLILTSAVTPGLIAHNIRAVQRRGGYGEEHACWEHAAIYIGHGILCEATRRGVRREMLSNYVGTHNLRFRRDNSLTTDQRYELAIAALSFQDYSYGMLEVLRLFKAARWGFGNHVKANMKTSGFPKRALICSELYADSYAKVTKRIVGNIAGGEVTPASLSADATLVDVPAQWLSI
jgi:hypothetical protein